MIPDEKQFVKAFALAIFIKHKFVSSTVTNFTIDKLHKCTGLHATTIKKRLKVLLNLGFVEFSNGGNRKHLTIKSMSSHNKSRNVDLSCIVFDSIKDIEKSLLALVIVEIQKRKDYAKQIINSAKNPKTLKECKSAKRKCRLFGYGREYIENGISYKRIAKELGVCVQKALKIVRYAVEKLFLEVFHRQRQVFLPGAKFVEDVLPKNSFTFCTRNNKYTIFANEYKVGSRFSLCGIY